MAIASADLRKNESKKQPTKPQQKDFNACGDIKSQEASKRSGSGCSHDSPAFSFNAKASKAHLAKLEKKVVPQGAPQQSQSDHCSGNSSSDRLFKSRMTGSNPDKFLPSQQNRETDSVQSMKIMRQQEVLLWINQKVRQLNSEFERTLRYSNNQEVKHKQAVHEKNIVIMMQNDRITQLQD